MTFESEENVGTSYDLTVKKGIQNFLLLSLAKS